MSRRSRFACLLLLPLLLPTGVRAEGAARAVPAAGGPFILDTNPAPGDQGKREIRGVKPGADMALEIIALREARGATGFTVTVTFDPNQLSFQAFEGGRLIPQMQIPPPIIREGTLEIGGSQFGGSGASQEGGSLGFLRLKATPRFRGPTVVSLVRARYRKAGEMKNYELQAKVVIRP